MKTERIFRKLALGAFFLCAFAASAEAQVGSSVSSDTQDDLNNCDRQLVNCLEEAEASLLECLEAISEWEDIWMVTTLTRVYLIVPTDVEREERCYQNHRWMVEACYDQDLDCK